ncbi:hypothetical protein CSV77_11160 [Sporosarcina sp. P16b]|uniref:P-type ATPase n=1 Tax=Sporosarcina sp. P16b TaxID=2048261 RepID=UPI000C166DC9|nr:hypothetical protein CSV77_11160 [Sporosarcina sp. P16b]
MNAKQTVRITSLSAILLGAAIILHFASLHDARQITLIAATLIAGTPIAIKAWKAIRMKAFSIELLVTIAVIGALFIGEYVESAAVTFLFLFGALLEIRTMEKTRSSLKALIDLAPLEASVFRDGKIMTIAVDEVVVGDRVIVRSGEQVPVDGPIVTGSASINEASVLLVILNAIRLIRYTSDKPASRNISEVKVNESTAPQ